MSRDRTPLFASNFFLIGVISANGERSRKKGPYCVSPSGHAAGIATLLHKPAGDKLIAFISLQSTTVA